MKKLIIMILSLYLGLALSKPALFSLEQMEYISKLQLSDKAKRCMVLGESSYCTIGCLYSEIKREIGSVVYKEMVSEYFVRTALENTYPIEVVTKAIDDCNVKVEDKVCQTGKSIVSCFYKNRIRFPATKLLVMASDE